jgi:hypothetical protein
MAECIYRSANAFRVRKFHIGDLSMKCSSHTVSHVTPMEFYAFSVLGNKRQAVLGNKRQTTSGLSTDIYERMDQILYKIRECLLSFGAKSFVFHFPIQKFKD